MSKPNRIVVALYQRSIRLYPRQFREEFGPDLGGLVADQLHDEPSWRVAARSVVDLALTVPTRHVEARMNRTPTQLVPLSFGALALASLVVGPSWVTHSCLLSASPLEALQRAWG
jgi:hypothetical protein